MPDVTLRQVAREAGVSPATVSLALRGSSKISSATITRVVAVAKELHYQANPMVSALMARQRAQKVRIPDRVGATLAFITPHRINRQLAAPPWDAPAEVFHGAFLRARQLGYCLQEIAFRDEGLSGERLNKMLLARGVLGLVFSEMPGLEEMSALEWPRFALVSVGTHSGNPALTHIQTDHYENMALAMRELFKLGYRRPGLALRPYLDIATRHRYVAAFLYAQTHLPVADRTQALVFDEDRMDVFDGWLRKGRPDVVITGNYRVRNWIEKMGFSIPGDIGLVHLDVSPGKTDCSGVHQRRQSIGAEAIDTIIAQIHRNERGHPAITKGIYIESDWVIGKTLRKKR